MLYVCTLKNSVNIEYILQQMYVYTTIIIASTHGVDQPNRLKSILQL